MLVIESPSKMQSTASTPSLEDIKALEQTRQRLQAVVTHLGQIQAQLAQTDPLPNWYVLLLSSYTVVDLFISMDLKFLCI